jgi:ankyrin repeat protein
VDSCTTLNSRVFTLELWMTTEQRSWKTVDVEDDTDGETMNATPDGQQLSDFFFAIELSHSRTVQHMLDTGMPADATSHKGISALLTAASRDDREIMLALLDAGADISYVGTSESHIKSYATPLNYACAHGLTAAISLLLELGADPSVKSEVGGNAAHHLLGYGSGRRRPTQEFIKDTLNRMLDAGLPADSCDSGGLSLLRHVLVAQADEPVMALLLDRGADPGVAWGEDGTQVIHLATGRSRVDLIRLLVDHGVDINTPDKSGRTPLFYANDAETLTALIEMGASIDHVDNRAQSVFQFAIDENSANPDGCIQEFLEPLLMCLVDKGANLNLADETGKTALERLASAANRHDRTAITLRSAIAARDAQAAMRSAIRRQAQPR